MRYILSRSSRTTSALNSTTDYVKKPVPTELRFQCFKITSIETTGQTAVKIIILGFVSVGLVTIDKLCKAVDQDMRISDIQWLEKQGGKSGQWRL